MRLKNRLLLGGIGKFGAALIRGWLGSSRYTFACADWRLDPTVPQSGQIFAMWHEIILAAAYLNRDRGVHVLISQSKDGEYMTRILENLGYHAVRGSSSRGSLQAVRGMTRAAEQGRLAITPDGPRGPRQVFQPGAIYLASRTGMPIIPVVAAFRNAWRAKNWDRLAIPRPFSLISGYFGDLIHVPPELGSHELEDYRQRAQAAMEDAERHAQRLLENAPQTVSGEAAPPMRRAA